MRLLRRSGIVYITNVVYFTPFIETFTCSLEAPTALDMYGRVCFRPSECINVVPTERISTKFRICNFHEKYLENSGLEK